MSDLIDRQAAIDTAIEAADKWDGGYSSEREGIIRKFFDKVPAVQPEIIRCKDCKFSHMTNDGRYCKYCDQFTDDYGELVEMYFDSDFYCGYAERRTE